MRRYLLSGFLLLLPILALNLLLADALPPLLRPEIFWRDIPAIIAWTETAARAGTLALPLLMPIAWPPRRLGWLVYGIGVSLYVAAWLALVLAPQSEWSRSLVGLAAPAFTPLLWLAGIGLVGEAPARWIRPAYLCCCALFLAAHNAHVVLVHLRGG